MWARLANSRGFYATLPWMPGGKELWAALRVWDPIILTGVPYGGWAGVCYVGRVLASPLPRFPAHLFVSLSFSLLSHVRALFLSCALRFARRLVPSFHRHHQQRRRSGLGARESLDRKYTSSPASPAKSISMLVGTMRWKKFGDSGKREGGSTLR